MSDIQQVLDAHNKTRAMYGLNPLVIDEDLNRSARLYAEIMLDTGTRNHSKRDGVGENLAWGSGSGTTPLSLYQRWADEEKYFHPGVFPNVGGKVCWHFTQLIWSSTTRLGVGLASRGKELILVCHYKDAGNWNGTYVGKKENNTVPKPTPTPAAVAATNSPAKTRISLSMKDSPSKSSPAKNTFCAKHH